MSYQDVGPGFYTMFQPEQPLHAGAPGWTEKPWVTWGNNPLLRGPRRLGVPVGDGTLGAYYATQPNLPISGLGGCGCGGGRSVRGLGELSPEMRQGLAQGLTITVVSVLGGLLAWSLYQERRRT